MMRSKERVLSAVEHKALDRLPIDLWADEVVWERLTAHFGTSHEGVLTRLGVDIRSVRPKPLQPVAVQPDEKGIWYDEWGVGYRRVKTDTGHHNDCVFHPLAEAASVAEVERYPWPDPENYQFDTVAPYCQAHDQYALVGGNGHFFCPGADLRGYETWFIDILEQSAVAHAIMERMQRYWLRYSERMLESSGDMLDIFYLADDYASQMGMMISVDCWRTFFRPYLAELVALGKRYGKKIFFHSCGAVRKLIPDLIDLGVDILNPIQIRAAGMAPEELVREYGRDLCFHGGVDLQHTLCRGTPQDVRDEVNMLIDTLGRYNGYIIAPGHTIISDAPMENIIALFEAAGGQPVREIGVDARG